MTLPRAIVTYHKQALEQKDSFGPGCKLHDTLFTHLAGAPLRGSLQGGPPGVVFLVPFWAIPHCGSLLGPVPEQPASGPQSNH
jgi:hypothetical protein